MWRWIFAVVLKVARRPAVQSWARTKAKQLIDKGRARVEARTKALADSVGIAVPKLPPDTFRVSRIIRTHTESLKPGNVLQIEGESFRITRLIWASAKEVIYEAEPV